MLIVSYVTKEYWDYGKRLKDNLESLKMPHQVEFIPSKGDPKRNKIWKPFFLHEMRQAHPQDTLCLVDGDGFFLKRPEVIVKAELGLIITGKPGWSYWFADSIHFHRPGRGENEFLRVWKFLCTNVDLVPANNHLRILAAFSLTMGSVSFEKVELNKSFARNYKKEGEIIL